MKRASNQRTFRKKRRNIAAKNDESKDMEDQPEPELYEDSSESYVPSEEDEATTTDEEEVKTKKNAEEIKSNKKAEEIRTNKKAEEVCGNTDLEETANLTLNSDLSTFFKKSQILDSLSDSNYAATTSDELREYCFFCNKQVKDFISHYNTDHETFQDTLNSSNFTPTEKGITIDTQQPVSGEINKNIKKTSQTQKLENKENKRIRLPDFCFYCEKQVHNFSRHLFRNHAIECEVQKILSLPKKSTERKKQLTSLRKKGNYVLNSSECIKPMKTKAHSLSSDYLPCSKCLGFYARKQLWKHRKQCTENSDEENLNTQANAQNFLVRHLKLDPKLKDTVFPHMRADKLSLVAKKDPIICAFGAQYLKIHREKHFINVVSRKMRELSKLLVEIKKIKPEVQDLFSALKPENYDTIVTAAKSCAKFDKQKECFKSPTFAMNISTSIKQCCNLAIMVNLKTQKGLKSADTEADLKTLIQLIEANWKFDVSSQAADDLNLRKWNKITIVPLASDLKLLKNHLSTLAKNASDKLKQDEINVAAFTDLVETVFCRVLLLNRRRPGELQRLLLDTYQSTEDIQDQYEEFNRAITLTEKVLINRLKRVVIRGKRGRGVPVLFTNDVQEDIQLLINVREKYIEKENPFLFAKPGCMTSVYGYKIIEKHAMLCKAKNPKAISSTRLRKHLATLTQIFNMTESDIEQLSNFMGHTSAVHKKSYRLPDEIYQTAKISKLLMLMEDGKADAYKGKSLDEIELHLEEELEGENIDTEEVLTCAADIEDATEASTLAQITKDNKHVETSDQNMPTLCQSNQRNTKKKRNLVPWTAEQKSIVLQHFKSHVRKCKPPKRAECDVLKDLYPDILANKDWLKIKVFIQNTYSKK